MDSTRRRSVVELYREACELPSQEARSFVESADCSPEIKSAVLALLAQNDVAGARKALAAALQSGPSSSDAAEIRKKLTALGTR